MYVRYDHYKRKFNLKKTIKDILFIYIIAVISVLLFNSLILQAFKVPSNSMVPQIKENTYILVNKFVYGPKYPLTDNRIFDSTKNIRRGDVVLFMSNEYYHRNIFLRFLSSIVYTLSFSLVDILYLTDNDSNIYIKRIIGLPGDTIKYKLNDNTVEVYINNTIEKKVIPINYKLIDDNDKYPLINEYKVKANEYYVLGDNRRDSSDSRIWGGVIPKQILGKAMLKYFPFNEFGAIK